MGSRRRESTRAPAAAGPSFGMLLGSGLGGVADRFPVRTVLPFDRIPGLPAAGVAGHKGELRQCVVAGEPVLFVCGRKHFYEGCAEAVDTLIGFVHQIGVRRLILTSAAGSLVKSIYPGELVLVDDILDLQFRPPRDAARSGRSHDLGRPGVSGRLELDRTLGRSLWAAGVRARVALGRGSVVTCAGSAYETAAEIRVIQQTGAALVTMSGAPEVAAANALGIDVAMVALVTNWAAGISGVELRHDDVLAAGKRAVPCLTRMVRQLIVDK